MKYRWLTKYSQLFLERDYLLDGQTVDERVDIICNIAEKILNKTGFAAQFKENIKKGWYSLSTPIWNNFGTDRGLPISCFGSYISDDMESILATVAEIGMMTKHGGGTSAYFGELRERGADIRLNGKSSGSVHFMQLYDNLIKIISQGSARRGQFAAYLPIDHKDIEEFLTIRSEGNPLQDISFGVCVKDDWMQSMIDGDLLKRKIWAKVLESRANTGYPYIFFTDNINNNTVDTYKDKKLTINASNLCFTGDQRIVTNRGLRLAKDLYEEGGELEVFDNFSKQNASYMQLIEKNADVYTIELDNGMKHCITSYHKVKVRTSGTFDKKIMIEDIMCKDLKIGDKVAIQTNKGIFGTINMPKEAFLLGMYQGDGTGTEKERMIDIWEHDFDLISDIKECYDYVCDQYNTQLGSNNRIYDKPNFVDCVVAEGSEKKKRLSGRALTKIGFNKGFIPYWIWSGNEDTQWSYIKGLFYSDGTVNLNKREHKGFPIQLALASIDKEFLRNIQLILANLGMQTSIRILNKADKRLLPDGKGGKKEYECKDCWRLIIGNKNDALYFNEKTGFLDRKNIKLDNRKYRDNTKKFYKINKIEYTGKEDVYCCTVNSESHHFVCNGIITHNCSEIMLPSNINESFVCDLSSMNILYYDEWKNTNAVELLVYFLDAVMSEFIEKASKIKFMERAVNFAKKHRALGIGWLGWHSYLQSKMIPWESMQAKLLNVEIAKNIKENSYSASAKLAKEFGEPEYLKGYGRRNTTLMAIAPTKSSAFILGQVSEGIEPHRTNYYIKDLQKGKFTIKNAQLKELLKEKNSNTDKVWNSILKNGGSVQHLDCLDDREKEVFKTFSEISPREIVIQAAQRQKYIDQSQSLNLMIHPSIPIKDVNALIIEAWKLGIKSLYYQISVNAAQQFSRNILNCSNCEG